MKVSIVALLLTSLVVAACAAPPAPPIDERTSEAHQAMRAADEDPLPDDPGGGGVSSPPPGDPGDPGAPLASYPGDLVCAERGAVCVAGVILATAACPPECATVAACALCALGEGVAIDSCANWINDCRAHAATEGEACAQAYRCDTNGLHCVDGACRKDLAHENQGCTADRDCQAGLVCDYAINGTHTCWRPRQVGEACQFGDCATVDVNGHQLTCDPDTHQCRRVDACTTHAQCGKGNYCNNGTCAHGCVDDSQCFDGDQCVAGGCTHTEVTICSCDGTDPPGTCLDCGPGVGGGGGDPGGQGGITWGTTCYEIYDTYTVCAEWNGKQDCDTTYELVDSFCY